MQNLKEFRQREGLSQEVMARKVGVTLSYYTQIERGHVEAGRGFMQKLKRAFPEISIDEVFFSELEAV